MDNKIHIEDHGILQDLTLMVSRINLFVGQNGAGKSALLEAIYCMMIKAMKNSATELGKYSMCYNGKLAINEEDTIDEEMKSDIIKLLKLVDSRVCDIQFDILSRAKLSFTDSTGNIKNDYSPEYFGGGMCYMVNLALKMMEARNGVLLIDEFGVGLHYSVIRKLWNELFNLSKKYNVQIFATAHSQDVIEGFSGVWKNNVEDGSFCRLSKARKSVIDGIRPVDVVNYDCEMLLYAIKGNIEVR